MQQFQVPQFIEVEDKIIGPFTLKQFLYLAGGAAIIFILYVSLPFWITVPASLPVAAFAFSLAFLKIHGRPFITLLNNGFNYVTSAKIYIWKKEEQKEKITMEPFKKEGGQLQMPKLTKRKLQDLSWSLDVQEKLER